MELQALWKIVLRRWWLIALPGLAALVYALYGYLKAPSSGGFATSIRFTAAAPPDGETISYEDREYYPWLSSEYVVNALTDWSKTSSFAGEVSQALSAEGIDIPAAALQGRINADNERSVMIVYLSWGNPDELASIAQAVIAVLQDRSRDYFPQLSTGGVTVVALDTPSIGPVPLPLSDRLDPVIRFGLGLAAGVALAFLVEYLDPTLRERAQVEALGLTVLAEVPRSRHR